LEQWNKADGQIGRGTVSPGYAPPPIQLELPVFVKLNVKDDRLKEVIQGDVVCVGSVESPVNRNQIVNHLSPRGSRDTLAILLFQSDESVSVLLTTA
jgi:hypothetical protein